MPYRCGATQQCVVNQWKTRGGACNPCGSLRYMNTRVLALSKAEDDSHLPTLLTHQYSLSANACVCSLSLSSARSPHALSLALSLTRARSLCTEKNSTEMKPPREMESPAHADTYHASDKHTHDITHMTLHTTGFATSAHTTAAACQGLLHGH